MVNIIICGTPGTGKSTLLERLKSDSSHAITQLNFLDLSKFAIDNKCIESYDEILDSHVIDEELLIAKLSQVLTSQSLNIIECIHADLLPTNLVDWIFVCRTDNTRLYDRLKARNYNEDKITNNLEAEIFQTILDEVMERDSWRHITTQLINNEPSDLYNNVIMVKDKINAFIGH